ncbi:CHAT domain-containing protein [Aureispira sp. CCB-QB1]|uniref:CHAT domain-containing protein n=1 Tax=Aureispira sp. CCB-QB1 TaxID=1313421 RepID=UPI000698C87C|nr:CHAT domain-containing tetratricopeptide repeat protein [Aureispira sp. CCB-QB1]
MNHLFIVVLLLLSLTTIAQDSDYIITKEDATKYGKIEGLNLSISSSAITFIDERGKTSRYTPNELLEWRKDGIIYQTKLYPFKNKKPVLTFMHLLAENATGISVYEYATRFNPKGATDIFLERDGQLTKVRFGRFRKQMIEYFSDRSEITALLKNREVKKKDLLNLVEEYNELVANESDYDGTPFGQQRTKKKRIWNLNDMLLSTDEAAKKYMAAIKEATKDILDKKIQAIEIDYGVGLSFFEQNKYDEALPYLKSAREAIDAEQIKTDKSPRIASMLAAIYFSQRKYNLAINYNSNALLLWENGLSNDSDAFHLYNSYITQGRIIQALRASASNVAWYEMTVNDAQKDWEEQLTVRNLAPIVHASKPNKSVDYNLALLFYKSAEDILYKLPRQKQIEKKIDLHILIGKLYFEAGDYPLSQIYYEKALESIDNYYNYNNPHPRKGEVKRILSEIYLANQLYSEALNYIDQAQHSQVGAEIEIDYSLLDNIYKIPFPLELLNSITTKGIILYEKNKHNPSEVELKKVLAHYAIATELLYKLRAIQRDDESKYQLGTITHRLSQHAVKICNTLYLKTQNQDYLHEAFSYAELSKSAVLFETIHNLNSMQIAGIPRNLTVMENGFKVQISYLKGEIFYEMQQGKYANKERIKQLQNKVEAISKEHTILLKKLERNYPEYYDLKYSNNKGVTLKQLQKALKNDEVFLEYVVTDTFVYVLAISNQTIKSQFKTLKRPLPYTVKKLQHALRDNKADLYAIHGNALYESVIGELTPFLEGKRLIIAPDAELNYIPFGVLPTNQPQLKSTGASIYRQVHFLIEDHPIYYNYSAGMFLLSKRQRPHKNIHKSISTWAPNFTAMETIIKDKGIGEKLRPLPGAQQEAQHIADMFASNAYINSAASELQFKSKAHDYSVLHIATHGVLNDLDPMFSSLILKNEGLEDGILHAFELYNMRLNADLAVLSACNSGMGKLAKGEGVVSIARGFSYAGIPNIIMSKWPVSDWSTELLMKQFYRNLKKGMPIDEALQKAKIKYLNENRENANLLAPFYWGGFVLSGNSMPINSLKDPAAGYLWYLGILLIAVALISLLIKVKAKFF